MKSTRWFNDPLHLLLLITALFAFVIQSGELGTADTTHRLQSSHALWTGEPPVFAQEYPEFGIHGRDGKLQSWYGIGQSLLMLPADIAGTFVERLPVFAKYNGNDPAVRSIIVSYSTSIFLALLTALVCQRFLRQLGFTDRQSILGTLALQVCTTHLHYTQNLMENNYIFLLTLAGFSFQLAWIQTGRRLPLFLGSAAFGLNLLTRITTGLDLLAGFTFTFLVLWLGGTRGRDLLVRGRAYLTTAIPVYLFFGLLDRLYQYYRFGSFFNSYIAIVASEARQRNPSLPSTYPFETPFHVGFFGPFWIPEKSIFLFDPLLLLVILLVALNWRRLSPLLRSFIIATTVLLFAYVGFYARYTVWTGDFAWGDRYVSTSVELVALAAIPLLLRYREALSAGVWRIGVGLVAIAGAIQLASLAFWLPLEIYQMETLGHPTFVIALRFKNIVAFALGRMDAWGLTNHAMTEDSWDYVHITTWNFLPFLLKRQNVAPPWVVDLTFAIWFAAIAALGMAAYYLARVLCKRPEDCSRSLMGNKLEQ